MDNKLKRNYGSGSVQQRLHNKQIEQRVSRASLVAQRRGVGNERSTVASNPTGKCKVETRKEQLKQWKEEKLLKQQVMKQRPSKPAFKVSKVLEAKSSYSTIVEKDKVRKNVYGGLTRNNTNSTAPSSRLPLPLKTAQKHTFNKTTSMGPSKGAITASGVTAKQNSKLPKFGTNYQKKSAAPIEGCNSQSVVSKLPEPSMPAIPNEENITERQKSKAKRASFAPLMFEFTAPSGLQSFNIDIENKNEISLPKTESNVITSNCNSKDHLGSKDSPSQGYVESAADTVTPATFRSLLATNTQTLKVLCDSWSDVIESPENIGESIIGRIRMAVGQSELLMAERFQQFSSLIDDCELGRGEKATLCTDLQGFWEMIYLQVEDVMKKFADLEEIKHHEWVENWAEHHLKSEKPLAVNTTFRRPLAAVNKVKSTRSEAARQRLAEAKAAALKRQQTSRELRSGIIIDNLVKCDNLQDCGHSRDSCTLLGVEEYHGDSVNKENVGEKGQLTPSKTSQCPLQNAPSQDISKSTISVSPKNLQSVSGDINNLSPVNRPRTLRLSEMFSPLKPGRKSTSVLTGWPEKFLDEGSVNLISFDGVDESLWNNTGTSFDLLELPSSSMDKVRRPAAADLPMILEES